MEITKFDHSCIRVHQAERSLVIDPGTFSPVDEALSGAEAILATHEHGDHLDIDAVLAAMKGNADLVLHAPAALAAKVLEAAGRDRIAHAAERIHVVGPGARFEAAGMEISTHGGAHAVIHRSLPVVDNIGYFISGELFHPGDSYQVPEGISVRTLLLPAHAPWAKIGQTLDFLAMVAAPLNIPIHDGLLNERGLGLVDGLLGRAADEQGLEYRRIDSRQPVRLGG